MSKKILNLIKQETKRQSETINLIASENIVPKEILDVLATPLVNKYSEGYPGKRYYPGNKFCDEIEDLAKKEGLKAFGLNPKKWFLNVQAYSGSPANSAIYFALANPKDKVMGMSLSSGGHLTHGYKINFSGRFYNSVQYDIDKKTGLIDYDGLESLAKKHKPKIIYSGTSAYSRIVDWKRIGKIAKEVGAYHIADISHTAGLIVGGVNPSPFPYSDVVMTTTHKTLRGPRGAVIFSSTKEISSLIDKAIMPGLQGGPHNNQTAGIALMFEMVQKQSFKKYAIQVKKNAEILSKELIKYDFNIVSGGTDTHLFLIDLNNKNIDGRNAEEILEKCGITANRNAILADAKPFSPSGIRIGTASVTSREMKEKEMIEIAKFIHRAIDLKENPKNIGSDIRKLCKKFPLPY